MPNIFQAANVGDLAGVEELLAQGGEDLAALVSASHKASPLYYAAYGGYLDVVNALIRAGAPLNVSGETSSLLHAAVRKGHHKTAALLLRDGAVVNARDQTGMTPLVYAQEARTAANLSPLEPTSTHAAIWAVRYTSPPILVVSE